MLDPHKHSDQDGRLTARRLFSTCFLLIPLAFGLLGATWGMDANWDLRNYHYYNAYAFLTGRIGWDLLVSQIPTFFNPTIDIPYYLLAQHLPARALGFILGAVQGLNFIPLALLADRILVIERPLQRASLACLIGLVGVTGAGTLSETGTVFYDTVVSLGVFASALTIISRWPLLVAGPLGQAAITALVAGLPVGLGFGLKQPTVVFAIGLCGAMLTVPGSSLRRFTLAFGFGIGVLTGLAAAGGHWMWHLWDQFRNPLFPFFNHVFQSVWALPLPYRDPAYLSDSLIERLTLLFEFSFNSRKAAEIDITDYRVMAAILAMGCAAIWCAVSSRRTFPILVRRGPAIYLMVAGLLSYAVWLWLFCIYRYLIPLEMLAPLLFASALGLLPVSVHRRLVAIFAGLLVLAASTRTDDWIRVPFEDKPVAVEIPAIDAPASTIVLLAGHEPLSFLIPSFPPEMRFLRIDSTFTNWKEQGNAFNPLMRAIVDQHAGALAVLFISTERNDVIEKLEEYRLAIDQAQCSPVTSPIGAAPYAYCRLVRLAAP